MKDEEKDKFFEMLHKEMNRCLNCDDMYEPRKDKNGMIPTEDDRDYMCKPCSTNDSLVITDYRKKMPCMTSIVNKCVSQIWVSKRDEYSPERPLFCPSCLMLFYSMRDAGVIENDLSKFYKWIKEIK